MWKSRKCILPFRRLKSVAANATTNNCIIVNRQVDNEYFK